MKDSLKLKLESLYLSGEREVPMTRQTKSLEKKLVQNVVVKNNPPSQSVNQSTEALLAAIREKMGDCQRCRLAKTRTNIVFGVGNPEAELMFVGEAPGSEEDKQGEPFVGRAGKLLDKIIQAMGLERETVYIANVVKCRPPENRNPAIDEIQTCGPFLLQQVEIIQPKVIVALGTFAAQTLMQTESKIGMLRGRFHAWPNALAQATFETAFPIHSVKLMPTYHPAFLLRNPNMKAKVWEDMQKVMQELGLKKKEASVT